MKIVCVSDTHGKHEQLNYDLPEGDMIIHAGDISNVGRIDEINQFTQWFSNLPYKYKIFIAGNHDFGFEKIRHSNEIGISIPHGVIYLQDEMVEIEGIKIYGSPWQPEFYDWAFNLPRGEKIAEKWNMIPENLDILITHGPPHGILDDTIQGMRVGCEDLYKRVMEVKPKYHIFGHIHYGYGMKITDETIFLNAASLGERYEYRNKPMVINI
jgi:Icc-related predicted phosphoesterase